ncbi:MAG: 2-C-methyl-D-erythritol 4-phosphate cytidylyltransferase [Phycisphaerae bacterium]
MPKVSVIIPAAGAGKRFGGDAKKPFTALDGRPIFIRCVELFINRADVCQTILTVAPEDHEVVREKYAANIMIMGIKLVKGGAERYESVRLALEAVDPQADLVCIHDGVRPCVFEHWIDAAFEKAAQTGATILAAPLTGTIKRVDAKQVIRETVPRSGLFEAQTPQVFARELIQSAYAKLPADSRPTDDAEVAALAGHAVSIILTDARNIKITHPGDLPLASSILAGMAKKAKGGPRGAFEEAQW